MQDGDSLTGQEGRPRRVRSSQAFDPDRLARYMALAEVDSTKLAEDAGVSLATMYRARRGDLLSASTFRKIGKALERYPKNTVLEELVADQVGVA